MGTRLFVGNLSYNVNEQELKEAFAGEGIEVRSVKVALDRESGRPRGFAFVETMTDDGAKQSIEKLSGRMLQGRAIVIEEAQARPAPGSRPPGGPGGFSGPRPGGFGGAPGGAPPAGGGFGAPRPGGFSGPPRPGGFSGPPGGAPAGGGFSGPPRPGGFSGPPRPGGFGGPPGFGAPRPGFGGPPSGPGRVDAAPPRRERPEKKKSTRPRPEDSERGNWRWKGDVDED